MDSPGFREGCTWGTTVGSIMALLTVLADTCPLHCGKWYLPFDINFSSFLVHRRQLTSAIVQRELALETFQGGSCMSKALQSPSVPYAGPAPGEWPRKRDIQLYHG